MIILEGPDNAGKSTLARQLSKLLEIPQRHSERPDPAWTPLECLEHSSRQLRPQRAILDRIYAISEPIYGPVCRGKNALGDKARQAILDLYQRPYLIIYCRPRLATILANNGRDQMDGVVDNHNKLVQKYDDFMMDVCRFSKCTVIQYDWQNKVEMASLVQRCKDHLLKFDQANWSATFLA
jgi:hypothetical protein